MGFSTGLIASIGLGLASTAVSSYSNYKASLAQKEQAEYQSAIANKNAELADEQANAQKREGYDNSVKKRLEVSNLISAQKARQAGSGVQLGVGSFLDLAMDTAERGESDALNLTQQGYDNAYNTKMQAWNYRSNANAYKSNAKSINPWLNAGTAAIGGLSELGSNYGSYLFGKREKTNKSISTVSRASTIVTKK